MKGWYLVLVLIWWTPNPHRKDAPMGVLKSLCIHPCMKEWGNYFLINISIVEGQFASLSSSQWTVSQLLLGSGIRRQVGTTILFIIILHFLQERQLVIFEREKHHNKYLLEMPTMIFLKYIKLRILSISLFYPLLFVSWS